MQPNDVVSWLNRLPSPQPYKRPAASKIRRACPPKRSRQPLGSRGLNVVTKMPGKPRKKSTPDPLDAASVEFPSHGTRSRGKPPIPTAGPSNDPGDLVMQPPSVPSSFKALSLEAISTRIPVPSNPSASTPASGTRTGSPTKNKKAALMSVYKDAVIQSDMHSLPFEEFKELKALDDQVRRVIKGRGFLRTGNKVRSTCLELAALDLTCYRTF